MKLAPSALARTACTMTVLHIDTTGVDADAEQICRLNLILLSSDGLTGFRARSKTSLYVNPGQEVSVGATKIHGLTWQPDGPPTVDGLRNLYHSPPPGEVCRAFEQSVGTDALVINNAAWTIPFLDKLFSRARLPAHEGDLIDIQAAYKGRELALGRRRRDHAIALEEIGRDLNALGAAPAYTIGRSFIALDALGGTWKEKLGELHHRQAPTGARLTLTGEKDTPSHPGPGAERGIRNASGQDDGLGEAIDAGRRLKRPSRPQRAAHSSCETPKTSRSGRLTFSS